jgi:nucleoside-diphosphate kinase
MPTQSTFIMVKPDGVRRRLVGEVIARLERKGLHLDAMRMLTIDKEMAETHYAEHGERPFFGDLVEFITSGPVVAMQWSGESAIAVARALMGDTNPTEAPSGTIRGDLALDISQNIVHGSDSAASAERELGLFFG